MESVCSEASTSFQLCPRKFNWNAFYEILSFFCWILQLLQNCLHRRKIQFTSFPSTSKTFAYACHSHRSIIKSFHVCFLQNNYERRSGSRRKMQFIIWRLKAKSTPGPQAHMNLSPRRILRSGLCRRGATFYIRNDVQSLFWLTNERAAQRATTENHIKFEFQSHKFYVTSNF